VVQEVEAPRSYRQRTHDGGKIVSPAHQPHLVLVCLPVTGWVDPMAIMWPNGFSQWKIPIAPSEIKHMNIQPGLQYLNQLCQHIPPCVEYYCFVFCLLLLFLTSDNKQCPYWGSFPSGHVEPHMLTGARFTLELLINKNGSYPSPLFTNGGFHLWDRSLKFDYVG
jgi:hypothetical protein